MRAVLLTGAGEKAFVAGADIGELASLSPLEGEQLAARGQGIFHLIENCGKPVIACINGFALGGGCELALACTLRIASSTARLGQPEVKIGIIPGYGGTQRLPRLIGKGAALKMILTGEAISAAEALRLGLVDEVVEPDQLLPRAEQIAADHCRDGAAGCPRLHPGGEFRVTICRWRALLSWRLRFLAWLAPPATRRKAHGPFSRSALQIGAENEPRSPTGTRTLSGNPVFPLLCLILWLGRNLLPSR